MCVTRTSHYGRQRNSRNRYITDRHLPDKAIDIIDEAGASQQLLPPSRRKKTIGVQDIENIVAKVARIPPKTVTTSHRDIMKNLDRNLKMVVFGQGQGYREPCHCHQDGALGTG